MKKSQPPLAHNLAVNVLRIVKPIHVAEAVDNGWLKLGYPELLTREGVKWAKSIISDTEYLEIPF